MRNIEISGSNLYDFLFLRRFYLFNQHQSRMIAGNAPPTLRANHKSIFNAYHSNVFNP